MTPPFLQAAARLDDIYKTVAVKPLLEPDELKAFYRDEVNIARGNDKTTLLGLKLNQAHGGVPYKVFLMGHRGIGKSTELTKLIRSVETRFRAIRLSAESELDGQAFQPFDILLLMMIELAEQTKKATGKRPSEKGLRKIWDWLGVGKTVEKTETQTGVEAAGGIGPTADSLWAKAVGLFASIKGQIKFASTRQTETVQYHLSRLSELVAHANLLLMECNQLLNEAENREWVFVWEDFEKLPAPPQKFESAFVTYGNVWREIEAHLIFTIPISLGYAKSRDLPFQCHPIPDTPVFHPDHTSHREGRHSLQTVLEARVSPTLFEKEQLSRLVVASGGNLRDLLKLTTDAADFALIDSNSKGKIGRGHVTKAINELRTEYERRLGEHPGDGERVTYADQAKCLMRVYNREEDAKMPTPVLYSLFRTGAVQEFNGERWLGVHPLVVDILHRQKEIQKDEHGTVPGGTE